MLDIGLLIIRLLLASVFIVSATTKCRDFAGTRFSIGAFGVPIRVSSAATVILIALEAVIAVGLLVDRTVQWAGLAALLLLWLFTGVILHHIIQGRHPSCHCFGRLGSSPIGWKTVSRNIVLMTFASIVLWSGGGREITTRLESRGAFAIVIGGIALLLVIIAIVTWPFSSYMHPFRLEKADQAQADVHRTSLLIFVDPQCPACARLLPSIKAWQHKFLQTEVIVIAISHQSLMADLVEKAGISRVVYDPDLQLLNLFSVTSTPSAVLVNYDSLHGRTTAQGSVAVSQMLESLNTKQQQARG